MATVLKRGGGVFLVGGQEVGQKKKLIEVIVDGMLGVTGDGEWYLFSVVLDPQQMKKAGFEDGDKVKLVIKAAKNTD